jgi:hypothetical protein
VVRKLERSRVSTKKDFAKLNEYNEPYAEGRGSTRIFSRE